MSIKNVLSYDLLNSYDIFLISLVQVTYFAKRDEDLTLLAH